MDDFQAASDRFLAWFKASGGELRDDLVEIRDLRYRNAGRGMVAIKDIPQNTVLFTIPRNLILNVDTSDLSRKIPGILDEKYGADEETEPLDSWCRLILVLLYEYLQGEASRWKPYLDLLPDRFDTPLFWSQTELEELKGTCLTAERIGKDESNAMLKNRILPIVQRNSLVFYLDGVAHLQDVDLLALAHRMGSTIMAYAFDLESDNDQSEDGQDGWVEDNEDKTVLGMVPLADMLNANADFNVHVSHGASLEITALRSIINEGSEILNYYGPLPSSELLRRYGYLTLEHRRYDIVEIPWYTVRSALGKCLNISEQGLQQADGQFDEDDLEDVFIVERSSGDPDDEGRLVHPVHVLEVSAELESQVKAYLKALKKIAPDKFTDKRKRETIYDSVLADVLATKLSAFPTNLQEDELLLAQPDLLERRRMAIQIRSGEKLLLHEALALINAHNLENDLDVDNPGKKIGE